MAKKCGGPYVSDTLLYDANDFGHSSYQPLRDSNFLATCSTSSCKMDGK